MSQRAKGQISVPMMDGSEQQYVPLSSYAELEARLAQAEADLWKHHSWVGGRCVVCGVEQVKPLAGVEQP